MKDAIHISFHDGCLVDVDYLFSEKNISIKKIKIERKNIEDFNITREKAFSIAPYLKSLIGDYKNIIFSDTAPLGRALSVCPELFQGKRTFHYICNRFNYGILDLKNYNEDFKSLLERKDSIFSVYTDYENFFMRKNGINIQFPVIKPTGLGINSKIVSEHSAEYFTKNNCGLLMPYLNEILMAESIDQENIFFGKYNGPPELKKFNFFIHFPYAYSNYFLFELMRVGKPIYIPSINFLVALLKSKKINYHFQDLPRRKRYFMADRSLIEILKWSEWYSQVNSNFFTYFDSIEHLNSILKNKPVVNIAQASYEDIKEPYINNIFNFFN